MMATIDSAVCMEEFIRQCEIALEAIGQLNYALMNLYQVPSGGSQYDTFKSEVFDIIYTFLGSAGCISGMLWPDGKDRQRESIADGPVGDGQERVEEVPHSLLKRKLGPVNKRLLKTVKRNWTDQLRLPDGKSLEINRTAMCLIIGSPLAVAGDSFPFLQRTYDPTTRNFHMEGETYPLQEIAAAIDQLRSCSCEKEKSLRKASSAAPYHRSLLGQESRNEARKS